MGLNRREKSNDFSAFLTNFPVFFFSFPFPPLFALLAPRCQRRRKATDLIEKKVRIDKTKSVCRSSVGLMAFFVPSPAWAAFQNVKVFEGGNIFDVVCRGKLMTWVFWRAGRRRRMKGNNNPFSEKGGEGEIAGGDFSRLLGSFLLLQFSFPTRFFRFFDV